MKLNLPDLYNMLRNLGITAAFVVALLFRPALGAGLELRAAGEDAVRLSYEGQALTIDNAMFRIEETMHKENWSRTASPGRIPGPGQKCPVRLTGHGLVKGAATHVVLWTDFNPPTLQLNLPAPQNETAQLPLYRVRFQWLGDKAELAQIKNPTARLYFPEGDTLDLPLSLDTQLITNRNFIEMSCSYETAEGEHIEYNRRSHVLTPNYTINWGGPLFPAAYARFAGKWAKPGRSLLWGAYLHNPAGDIVSVNEFPREHPHPRKPSGHPTYLDFCQRYSGIQWKQTLHRIDGGPVPENPENLSDRDIQNIGDLTRMSDNYLVAVSYVLHGRKVEMNVPLSHFVTWKSKHISLEAPIHWTDRATAYLDKMERIYTICQPLQQYTPDFIQLFWSNNYGAGYTVGPKTKKRVSMGFFDLRDRKDIYSQPDTLIHEVLHAFGYHHGAGHNQAISKGSHTFDRHDIVLADHPEYTPEPVTIEYSIEDTRDDGADNYGKFPRIPVPHEQSSKSPIADLGPFRGHKPRVESRHEALQDILALTTAKPLPGASFGDPSRGGPVLDLLKQVDVGRDSGKDKWEQIDGQIISPMGPYARLELPLSPSGSYQLEVQFTRDGGDAIILLLPVGDSNGLLVVSGWSGEVSGLAYLDGKDANNNKTTRDGKLADRTKHTLLVEVSLLDKDQARIAATLDSQPYLQWNGPITAITPGSERRLPHPNTLGLGTYNATVIFHSCRVKMLSGTANPLH